MFLYNVHSDAERRREAKNEEIQGVKIFIVSKMIGARRANKYFFGTSEIRNECKN